jgi:hypothetical protein
MENKHNDLDARPTSCTKVVDVKCLAFMRL